MGKLEKRVAIITGGGSGIGREIALGFSREKAKVVIFDINEVASQETLSLMETQGTTSAAMRVDVRNRDEVTSAVKRVEDDFGRVDILVNNAGYLKYQPFLDMSQSTWDDVLNVCLKGYFLCGQEVAKSMMQRHDGKIVHVTSVGAYLGFAGAAAYSSAKGGIIALVKTMASELAPYDIRVNGIAPGVVLTDMVRRNMTEGDRLERLKRIPMKRFGLPEDIVGPAIFLASEESAYLTGHILVVDGGSSCLGVGEYHEKKV